MSKDGGEAQQNLHHMPHHNTEVLCALVSNKVCRQHLEEEEEVGDNSCEDMCKGWLKVLHGYSVIRYNARLDSTYTQIVLERVETCCNIKLHIPACYFELAKMILNKLPHDDFSPKQK